MADKPRDVIVPIVFDEEAIGADLEHLTDAAGLAFTPKRGRKVTKSLAVSFR